MGFMTKKRARRVTRNKMKEARRRGPVAPVAAVEQSVEAVVEAEPTKAEKPKRRKRITRT